MGTRTVSNTINLQNPGEQVSKYITEIDGGRGITVHAINMPEYIQINSNGLQIYTDNTINPTASFGNVIQLGKDDTPYTSFLRIEDDILQFFLTEIGTVPPDEGILFQVLGVELGVARTAPDTSYSTGSVLVPGVKLSKVQEFRIGEILSEDEYVVTLEYQIEEGSTIDIYTQVRSAYPFYPWEEWVSFTYGESSTQTPGIIQIQYNGSRTFKFSLIEEGVLRDEYVAFDYYGYPHSNGGYLTIGSRSSNYLNEGYTLTAGRNLIATSQYQSIFGKFNKRDDNALFMIGNGTSNDNRSNLFTIDKNGSTQMGNWKFDVSVSGHCSFNFVS